MQIPHNHIFYTAKKDIAEILIPISQLGISYFTFTRNYHDGTRLYLTNCSEFFDNYFKEQHYLNGNTECKPDIYKNQVLHWSTAPNQKIINDCPRAWGFDHGIWMFESHDNYCEIISFATHSGNNGIINTYLSKMDFLKSFRQYFRDKASSIIKQAEKQKLVLPFNELLDIKCVLINIEDNDMLNSKLSREKFLTDRQLECCSLLLKGKSAREIAVNLKLSPRTIEYYFDIVKTKLNCKNKAELIIKLLSLMK